MKESSLITLLIFIFAFAGLLIFFLSSQNTEFNFYKSEISASGKIITEKLYFHTDKPYHTLYRNFQSPVVYSPNFNTPNFIYITGVKCSSGNPYVRDNFELCNLYNGEKNSYCPAYTERNEYGCTFGSTLGFEKSRDYWIESTYELNPENIFLINNDKYIKFIVYSAKNHNKLTKDTLLTPGTFVRESKYSSNEDVIVYIPYETNSLNVINQEEFEFDKSSANILLLILTLLPSIILALSWFIFGKEKTYADIPEELSFYPNERKAWEVAAYFNPPFSVIDKNFFATMLIDFYHRKIIDIRNEGKEIWIKVNEYDKKMDEIEKDFFWILKKLYNKETSGVFLWKKTLVKDGWINLKDALSTSRRENTSKFMSLAKDIKKQGKKYIDSKGGTFISIITAAFFVFGWSFLGGNSLVFFGISLFYIIVLYMGFLITTLIVSHKTSLFIRFKESYYQEYQHWQAFKKYLDNSFSITTSPYKGIVIWNHFLVYGTALGVSEKVIEQLKQEGVLNDRNYGIYMGVYHSSGSFAASTDASGGGGFGGAGGGGVGGGGGGGR